MNIKPSDPRFSCGPTRKFAKWSPHIFKSAPVGRYHRSETAKTLINDVYAMTREALSVPHDYHVMILPGSSTGAINSIMANTLGDRPVQAYSQGVFGQTWAGNAAYFANNSNAKLTHEHALCAMPDMRHYDADADTLVVMNETSVGAKLANLDWIAHERDGLTICDVTSSAFVNAIDWAKTDIAVWSWQKALASESGFGMVALAPKAVERILVNKRILPKLFTLTDNAGSKLVELVNTLSLLALQDVHFSLSHYLKQGGQPTFYQAATRKRAFVNDWLSQSEHFADYVSDGACRSDTVVYVQASEEQRIDNVLSYLTEEHIAYDIGSHRHTAKGIRFWIGPSIPCDDVVILSKWLEYALEYSIKRH